MSKPIPAKQLQTAADTVSTVTAGGSAADGSSNSVARKDHTHAVTTGGGTASIAADGSAGEGTGALAREDHTHAVDTTNGAISTINAGDAASEGSGTGLSRRDHQHAVGTAVCVAIGTTNAEGTSSDLARADHVHAHGTQTDGGLHAIATGSVAGFMSSADKTKLDGLSGSTSSQQEEVTAQAITGSDTAITDTLNATPVSNASVKLYLNGVLQNQGAGNDYTLSSTTITWLAGTGTAVDLEAADELIAVYQS